MRFFLLLSLSLTIAGSLQGAEAPVDFDREVRPILSDMCFTCHGPDENTREAELRLDQRTSVFAKREPTLIVPGKPEQSELYRRMVSADEAERMPPVESGRKLSKSQTETIRKWIEQGANWEEHWAFRLPKRPAVPRAELSWQPRNAIDGFIARRLEQAELQPNEEADRIALIRRVTLDLTGLPPTLEEVDRFLADRSPHAYESLVERLLASPAYGEHFATPWLDAARYSDTNGYQQERTRTMWPWRDWVIRSLNANVPFDRFTVEQLAGDLLPDATVEQRLATGFHRNHMLNGEGGRIAEESRVEYVVDRVDTTATVWMGLTMGCARCHDHKYDPLSQAEFYQFFAYFNNINERGNVDRGGNANPVMKLPTPEQDRRQATLIAEQKKREAALRDATNGERQREWETRFLARVGKGEVSPQWQTLTPTRHTSANGATLKHEGEGVVFVSGKNPVNDTYTVHVRTDQTDITAIRLQSLTHPTFTNNGLARSNSGNFVLTELEVRVGAAGGPVKIASASADFEQSGHKVELAFDGNSKSGWAVYKPGDMQHDRAAVFRFAQPITGGKNTELAITLRHDSPHAQHNIGRFRLSATSHPKPSLQSDGLTPELIAAVGTTAGKRSAGQKKQVRDYFLKHDQLALAAQAKVDKVKRDLESLRKSLLEVMVMEELPKPRETYVLKRGAWDQPDKNRPQHPSVPRIFPPLPAKAAANRLALAEWLVDPRHPLTARVAVNRAWQHFFGVGLVKTAEDFGTQGERPSHPQLLDWLATEFVRTEWDVKALHRLIVTSATYRQSSKQTAAKRDRDPYNRLLSRGPRYRLTAQTIRDHALAVSGLLVRRIGGRPVKPYQPEGVWLDMTLGKIKYQQDHGDDLYRRSVYVFWRRSVGPTMLFDTSARQVCKVRPGLTNTPLHALTLMNETTYVESARVLGERMMTAGNTPKERLAFGFRAATSRLPTDGEQQSLTRLFQKVLADFKAHPDAVSELLSVGESQRDSSLDATEHAAYTAVANVILNLDEVMVKE